MAMHTIALSQLRTQPRRYISVVLAILIGTAFLAASFLVASSGQATLRTTMAADYAQADLVVLKDPVVVDHSADTVQLEQDFVALAGTPDEPGPVSRLTGVDAVYAMTRDYATLYGSGARQGEGSFTAVINVPEDLGLASVDITEGRFPAWNASNEVALDAETAQRLNVSVGDTVLLTGFADEGPAPTVVGITSVPPTTMMGAMPQLYAGTGVLKALIPADEEYTGWASSLQLMVADDADPAHVAAEVEAVFAEAGHGVIVSTPDEAVRASLAETADGDVLGWILGGFAVLALLVTGLVIANTFQVLVAQRTRELGLLRTLGSTAGQVRRSVMLEAVLVGLIGVVLGVLTALALTWGVVMFVRTLPNFDFVSFEVAPLGLLISVAVGVLVTLVAALRPALSATRVSPLQAMQPREEITVESSRGRVFLVLGALMAVGGAVIMVYGAIQREPLLAIGGGPISFLGVMVAAGLFIPASVRAASLLARPAGVPGRLAGLNAVRQRSRTTATAAALLIGTTLVSLFLVAGRTGQVETDTLLNNEFPIDVVLQTQTPGTGEPSQQNVERVLDRVGQIDGVSAAMVAQPVGLSRNGSVVYAVDVEQFQELVNTREVERFGDARMVVAPVWANDALNLDVAGQREAFTTLHLGSLETGVYISLDDARDLGWEPGMSLPEREEPADAPESVELGPDGEFAEEDFGWGISLDSMTPQVLVDLDNSVRGSELRDVVAELQDVPGLQDGAASGGAPQRAAFATAVDAILWVVLALLAVSVLIALIGVANTLSLSTIERTRENALLRALGLSKKGLRGMIAIEAVLIAGVAALLGVALGTFYGWGASQLMLGGLGGTGADGAATELVPVAVPWLELLAVVGVAAVAGLVASLLPARRATRLSPVEGLATV
ncbi:MAG: ABC transporter permease [Micrococcus sp.]|nr:ABC transporter permease [Micrococcus sp.]